MNAHEVVWERDACPFLKFPGADCYCLKLEKHNIDRVMQFCGADYLNCGFFRDRLACLDGHPGVVSEDQGQ